MTRKRRTREHVIEDLSFNHVERHVLICGWSTQRQDHDYGIDLTIHTYDENGEIENGYIPVQLKATDHLKTTADGSTVLYNVDRDDLEYWLSEIFPVVLIRYDAQQDVAYWLHVQAYFEGMKGFDLSQIGKTFTVYFPVSQVFSEEVVENLRTLKNATLQKYRG